MKYAVVILALVVAVSAQFNTGQYNNEQYNPFNPYNNQYNNQYKNQYKNPYNQYNRNPYNRYNQYTTPSPFRYRPTTIAPPVPTVTIAPAPFTGSTPAPPVPTPTAVVPVGIIGRYAEDYNAEILKFGNENAPDGSFNYFYETSNGIAAQEQGVPRVFAGNPPVAPVVAQGSFSWTSPEGVPVAISYIADENGYQPQGDAIPTPHPIPAQILRSLEYNARNAPQKK